MAPTEGRVAKPERRWDCRRGTPKTDKYPRSTRAMDAWSVCYRWHSCMQVLCPDTDYFGWLC